MEFLRQRNETKKMKLMKEATNETNESKNETDKIKKRKKRIKRKDLNYETKKYMFDFQQYETIRPFSDF